MRKKQTVIRTLLFLLLLLVIFLLIYAGTYSTEQAKPDLQTGRADLSDFDFEKKLAILPASFFVYYPNILYTPETVPEELYVDQETELAEGVWAGYGTYRMILDLPAERSYSIRAYSALHSQRLFVNGEELLVMGVPGTSAATTVAETGYYTVTFTPETNRTEILIQTASFHFGGGGLYDLLLGKTDNIRVRIDSVKTRIHLIEGGLIMAFFLSSGVYLFFNRRVNLWFSLACIAVFIRIAAMEETNLLHFALQLSWEDMMELMCLSTVALGFCFVLYIKDSFTKVLHPVFVKAFGVCCLLTMLIVVFTSSAFYTRVIFITLWVCGLFLIYAVVMLTIHILRHRKALRMNQVLPFTEFVVFTICFLLDMYFYRHDAYNMSIGLMDLGAVICIYINTIVPIIDFSNTSMERDKVRLAEQEIRETNRMLDRLNRIRLKFLQNLSHELRTPLTVMSSCAGLTSLQIRNNSIDEDTLENMEIIKREATRLANLVEQIKEISVEKEWQLTLKNTDVQSLLQRTANFCVLICRKNENTLIVEAESGINMLVNADAIFQVLLNLIINANRHTKGDTILLKAEKFPSGDVRISVIDHGEGIPLYLMPHIYDRYVSGDGGSGLGLPICKEIIEQHGGTMEILSTPGKGTVIYMNIPKRKEEFNDPPIDWR